MCNIIVMYCDDAELTYLRVNFVTFVMTVMNFWNFLLEIEVFLDDQSEY